MAQVTVKAEGLDELLRKLDGRILAKPLKKAFRNATLLLQRDVQKGVPVDTGRLRSSVTSAIDSRTIPLWGQVGSKVKYAPFVEYGSRPHWPPLSAMQPWARRHGFPPGRLGAFLVARAISRRGTRAVHMFRNAWNRNVGKVNDCFSTAAKEIEDEWYK